MKRPPSSTPGPRPGKPTPAAGRWRQPALRMLILAALAGVAFGAAYALTKLRTTDQPPGMVWVPGGEFTMGTDSDLGWPDERPAHRVRVDGFWIDATEVTNAQFRRFAEATGYVTT